VSAPLAGLRVWLTRPEPHDAASAAAWSERGAQVVVAPTVTVEPRALDDADRARIAALESPWIVLPSPRAVTNLVLCLDVRRADGVPWPVAAIGEATADRARAAGFDLRHVGTHATGEVFARELLERADAPRSFVLASSDRRREALGRVLREAGHEVVDVVVHRTVVADGLPAAVRPVLEELDVVAFYSPSAVEFVGALEPAVRSGVLALAAACMGSTTADAARAAGFGTVLAPAAPGEPAMLDAVGAWRRGS
jgi:uroporphyrinogen-III synthase